MLFHLAGQGELFIKFKVKTRLPLLFYEVRRGFRCGVLGVNISVDLAALAGRESHMFMPRSVVLSAVL